VYDTFSNQLRNVVVDKHDQGAIWGGHPILALDVWEHSYYHDYGPARGEFVDNFFEVVDWNEPATRYEQSRPSSCSSNAPRSDAPRRVGTPRFFG